MRRILKIDLHTYIARSVHKRKIIQTLDLLGSACRRVLSLREARDHHPKCVHPKFKKKKEIPAGIDRSRATLSWESRDCIVRMPANFSLEPVPLLAKRSFVLFAVPQAHNGTRRIRRMFQNDRKDGPGVRPGRTHRVFLRTTGYINYTCKYKGARLTPQRSNREISIYVSAIPAPFPLFTNLSLYLEPGLAYTHSRTCMRTSFVSAFLF